MYVIDFKMMAKSMQFKMIRMISKLLSSKSRRNMQLRQSFTTLKTLGVRSNYKIYFSLSPGKVWFA